MQNWTVWNWTVFEYYIVLRLNWIIWIKTVWLKLIAWNRTVFDN